MARLEVEDTTIAFDLPVQVPELTLRFADVEVAGIAVDGEPLAKAGTRADFRSGTFWVEDGVTWAAFDPQAAQVSVEVQAVEA